MSRDISVPPQANWEPLGAKCDTTTNTRRGKERSNPVENSRRAGESIGKAGAGERDENHHSKNKILEPNAKDGYRFK